MNCSRNTSRKRHILGEIGLLKELTKAVIERCLSHKQMKEVATDLKTLYSASTESEAEFNLDLFAEKWDTLYPSISKSWRAHWTRVIPLFSF